MNFDELEAKITARLAHERGGAAVGVSVATGLVMKIVREAFAEMVRARDGYAGEAQILRQQIIDLNIPTRQTCLGVVPVSVGTIDKLDKMVTDTRSSWENRLKLVEDDNLRLRVQIAELESKLDDRAGWDGTTLIVRPGQEVKIVGEHCSYPW